MPSLDDLKKRIKSVKSTQKITKAMKMVAAAKLKKAQENAEKGRPYSQKMQNIILNLTKSINDPNNAPKLLVGTGHDKTYLCVVLTADRGLCGGFNGTVTRQTRAEVARLQAENKTIKLLMKRTKPSKHSRYIPQDVKIQVVIRDNGMCQSPGCFATNNLHFDHIYPYSKGGRSDDVNNIQLLCSKHNWKKSDN